MHSVGLDISKDTIDAVLLDESGKATWKKVDNTSKGFEQLKRWLKNRRAADVHVCMEATGSYYENAAESFTDGGYLVSVVNPLRVKAYATSLLSRTKTDRVDAAIIAEFCRSQNPPAWVPPSPQERQLRGLVRFCGNLVETRAAYRTQRKTPNLVPAVAHSIDVVIDDLTQQIDEIERQIATLIDGDSDLRGKRNLIASIQGVAEHTASLILAECPHLADFADGKAVSAFAGLSPRIRESGTSVRGRNGICKTGNARLRRAFWWPAIVAMRCNQQIREFAARLKAAGKPNKKIIIAVMRKILVIAYGILKSGRPYDGGLATS